MPKVTNDRIVFEPKDRQAITEQSPGITPAKYTTLFNGAIADGDTTRYFKFLEEIKEKDPDILQAIETRTTYITSKEWTVVGDDQEEGGDQSPEAEEIEEALRDIAGDPAKGLMTVDELINSMLGDSYLIGISFAEIVTDENEITGFQHIPGHFLTFKDAVYYPKLWTAENHNGIPFNQEKMISHYLTSGIDPVRGWLGNGVAWQFVFKRGTLEQRQRFEKKYGKGFMQLNMPGERDSFIEDWNNAESLIENLDDVDGVVFGSAVEADFKETMQAEGDYFFEANDNYKRDIAKIILGQESTSSSQDSNRSTADVHMEVLEKRILEDSSSIEDTLTQQLVKKIQEYKGISTDKNYEFKFVVSEMEATLDEELEEEGAVEEATGQSAKQTEKPEEDDEK